MQMAAPPAALSSLDRRHSLGDDGPDPELLALPAPPWQERAFTLGMMVVTSVAAIALGFALRGEVAYALAGRVPQDIGDLARTTPTAALANHYVRASGLLSTASAIRYERPMEGDSFRLAPIAGNPKVWVEIRVPEGMEGPKFAPPTSFAGRLVPMAQAGIRQAGLPSRVAEAGLGPVPADAWLLVDGASPRASRWSLALLALLGYFAVWNVVGLAKLVARPKT